MDASIVRKPQSSGWALEGFVEFRVPLHKFLLWIIEGPKETQKGEKSREVLWLTLYVWVSSFLSDSPWSIWPAFWTEKLVPRLHCNWNHSRTYTLTLLSTQVSKPVQPHKNLQRQLCQLKARFLETISVKVKALDNTECRHQCFG